MDWLLELFLSRLVIRGSLTVISAGGRKLTFGDGTDKSVTARFTSRTWQLAVILDPELRLGEAYMYGGLVIEHGSIADLLEILVKNLSRQRPTFRSRFFRKCRSLLSRVFRDNNEIRSWKNASHHYDIDHRIYELFLDPDMQYSCAYFEEESYSIEDAQQAKKQHIAAKLYLSKPGLKVLDIGSGWGGLGLHLARTADASVVGINLAQEQVAIARRRAALEGLPCDFRKQDYRSLTEKFDRIVSVGMFEHVGKRHYREFFRKCFDVLSDDGVMLLHTIGRWDGPWETNAWVERYIFPGGYAPALSELAPVIERAGFIISDIEFLHLHYAETLHRWRTRLLQNLDKVRDISDDKFLRMWEFYLAGFEPSFRNYGLTVFQIQLIKDINAVPMTRRYIYDRTRRLNSDIQVAAE